MSFAVEAVSSSIEVRPGDTEDLAFRVANKSEQAEEFEVVVEGLDAEWVAIPVAQFVVEPGQSRIEKVYVKPPRSSESSASLYPCVIRVRSLESGETRQAQAEVQVMPYDHLSLDLSPRKTTVSPMNKESVVDATVMNLGNTDHAVQLFASDQDDLVAFEIEHEQISLSPGQQKVVPITLSATKMPLVSNTRVQPFTVTARSVDRPSVAASGQGQLQQKALFSVGTLAIIGFIAALLAAWIIFLPKPPVIDSYNFNPSNPIAGEQMTVTWASSHTDSVTLRINNEVLESQMPDGSHTFVPEVGGQYQIEIIPVREAGPGPEKKVFTIQVREPEVADPPKIESFVVTPTDIKLGQSIKIAYALSPSVARATLMPSGRELELPSGNLVETPTVAGDLDYEIIAYNADGDKVNQRKTVKVSDSSLAAIERFSVSPTELPAGGGGVDVEWAIRNASQARLTIGDESPQDINPAAGSIRLDVFDTTTFTLVAYDQNGKPIEQKVTVTIRPPVDDPDPIDDPPPTPDTTGGTGGTGGAPTGGTTAGPGNPTTGGTPPPTTGNR